MLASNRLQTPAQRKEIADEWRWWRRKSAAGARRAWVELRRWRRTRHLDMRIDVLKEILGG